MTMPPDADQLFAKVSRSPFSGGSVDQVVGQMTEIPLEPAGVAQEIWLPPSIEAYARRGLYNGDFSEPPPDGDGSEPDNAENILPGWRIGGSGSTMTVTWNEDTTAPYGASVRIAADDTADVGDELYLEQVIRVGGRKTILVPMFTFTPDDVWINYAAFIRAQFFKYDGTTTTGSELDLSYTFSNWGSFSKYNKAPRLWATPPADAMFLRIRIGMEVALAEPGFAAYMDIYEASVEPPTLYPVTLIFHDDGIAAGGSTTIGLAAAGPSSTPSSFASRYSPDLPGWFVGMSVYTDDVRTAGSLTVNPYWVDGSVEFDDPECVINATNDQYHQTARTLFEDGLPELQPGADSRYAVLATASAGWAPTTADVTVALRILLFEP